MISVIIPSRNEQFLPNTVEDLLAKAEGEIEIIVIMDGYWHDPPLKTDPRVHIIHRGVSHGLRAGINAGVALAKGTYILKTDAHCLWQQGYDKELIDSHQSDWVVVPRRKRLDAENWCEQDVGKPDVDYEFLSFPDNPADFGGPGLNGRIWTERIRERLGNPEYDIDENMSFQGSAWFMSKEYFEYLELMDEANYGTFWNEAQELGMKSWLSGGKVMTNKRTSYCHLHKGKTYGRGYSLDHSQLPIGAEYTKRWIQNDAWDKQTIPFSWLIDRFSPPTWPDNWRDLLYNGGNEPKMRSQR